MKLMNILGWSRTKLQKQALKSKRKDRRLKHEAGKYAEQKRRMENARKQRMARRQPRYS